MFLIHALQYFIAAFAYYFSHAVLYLISIPIAAVRTCQVLFKHRMGRTWQIGAEISVDLIRLLQFTLAVAIGTDTSVRSLFSSISAWGEMFAGIHLVQRSELVWDTLGFVVIFALYNVLLHRIFRKTNVEIIGRKIQPNGFDSNLVQTASILAIKNLFVIPVSVIYIFQLLKFIG